MDSKTLTDPTTASNMLDALVELIADRVAAKLNQPTRAHYSRRSKPTGEKWETLLARAKANGIPTVRMGREVLIDAPAWDAWVASKTTKRPTLTDSDAASLRALGLVSK